MCFSVWNHFTQPTGPDIYHAKYFTGISRFSQIATLIIHTAWLKVRRFASDFICWNCICRRFRKKNKTVLVELYVFDSQKRSQKNAPLQGFLYCLKISGFGSLHCADWLLHHESYREQSRQLLMLSNRSCSTWPGRVPYKWHIWPTNS